MKSVPRQSRSTRVINILEAVARADHPLRPADLMEACDLPKATVHRICGLLTDRGYLRQPIGGRGLVPGPRLFSLANEVLSHQSFNAVRHAVLESLAREVGETCNIAIPAGTHMIYWDRVETHWPLKFQLPIGSRVPLHCTAGGKLYLSTLPPDRRAKLIAQLDLDRRTSNTITDPQRLEEAVRKVAEEEMGVDDEEFIEGMIAVSVPVKGDGGRMVASLAMHAPVFRVTLDEARTHVDRLREAAKLLISELQEAREHAEAEYAQLDLARRT